jgi:putative ATP-dependent endonuclease of the OLD family
MGQRSDRERELSMHITRVHIEGFKRFTKFDLELNRDFNIIVGDNETGKSSLLEAMSLVLTGQRHGRLIQYAVDPYLFNATAVADYFQKRQNGEEAQPPEVVIEAYFQDDSALAKLKGTNNTRNEDCPGLVLTIAIDSSHVDDLKAYASDNTNPYVLPVEYYKPSWRSFASNNINLRDLPVRAATIDNSLTRVYRGPNKYLSQVVSDVLSEDQLRQLSLAYKKLRHGFTQEAGVKAINEHLEEQGNPATTKKLTIQMDLSTRASWDTAISAHLDDLPFDCAGSGEQCRVQMRLAIAGAKQSRVLLIEEPENHLSHSNLNIFMDDIRKDCADRQVIITTHSAFVLNKLGIDNLRFVSPEGRTATLAGLSPDTRDYFMKLPGYNTLRLILSQQSILVEGPSDELIVQRAYKDKHGRLPLAAGIDVISVGSLAFKRFLEIAELLNLDVRVLMDNDGDVEALKSKYEAYIAGKHPSIRVCFDGNAACPSLEPQLLKANSLDRMNRLLGTKYRDEATLLKHMGRNKTDCALRLFETSEGWIIPEYIAQAIE